MENKVLDFIASMQDFERRESLFSLRDGDLYYWDIVRLKVNEKLFYTYVSDGDNTTPRPPRAPQRTLFQTVVKVFSWAAWFVVNEINFHLFTPRKKWLFLKVSRFYNAGTQACYDAVADEIHEQLKEDSLAMETFKNRKAGPTRLGHRYQTFHMYRFRINYAKRHFQQGKTYEVSRLLRRQFPETAEEDWDLLIQQAILAYQAEAVFSRRILKKVRPKGLFFTGAAKGFTTVAKQLGITVIEIQHSPLNKADVQYSYAEDIDYSHLDTQPDYMLVNSQEWQKRVYTPTVFVNVGSDYFYRSSKPNPAIAVADRRYILFVSDPVNHDFIRSYIDAFVNRNELQDYQLVFKLHSAETDRYEEAKRFFSGRQQVQVILNERNISELLDESCATFVIYSTVAYQAVQKGLKVFLLKTGYYEGGYDLFDLPNVRLTALDELVDMVEITATEVFEPTQFFEAFDRRKLRDFISKL